MSPMHCSLCFMQLFILVQSAYSISKEAMFMCFMHTLPWC